MAMVTNEQLHEDIKGVKKELQHLRELLQEDFALAEDVVEDMKESRKRPSDEMISHEEMKKEFE